jgi:hypothetical protein
MFWVVDVIHLAPECRNLISPNAFLEMTPPGMDVATIRATHFTRRLG